MPAQRVDAIMAVQVHLEARRWRDTVPNSFAAVPPTAAPAFGGASTRIHDRSLVALPMANQRVTVYTMSISGDLLWSSVELCLSSLSDVN
jgi:hypothetical protein